MAIPGIGFKTACDVLMEISYHLIEQVVRTTISSLSQPGGYGTGGYGQYGYGSGPPTVVTLGSNTALYVGAQVVVGWGLTTAEVATVTGISVTGAVYLTALVNSHSIGETVLAPTFPTQQTTDPFFTQSEMLGYLSRAQNEFLSQCPVFYQLTYQNLSYGQIFQTTPANCIEINRVAASQFYSVIESITRASNVATVVTQAPHGLAVGSTIFIQNSTAGFGGIFEVSKVPSSTSLTYTQTAADATAGGGAILYFSRIYETTQTEISMTDRTWRNDYVPSPTQWFEDRSGLYRWGVGGKPSSNYPVELLCSIRDTDTLGLLDGFLVPDTLSYILKYKALAYALSKDGVQQDPTRAKYCEQRFERGCAMVNRYIDGMAMGLTSNA